jgi:hypothetical protein
MYDLNGDVVTPRDMFPDQKKTTSDLNRFQSIQDKFKEVINKLKTVKASKIESQQAETGLFVGTPNDHETSDSKEMAALKQFESALSSAPTPNPTGAEPTAAPTGTLAPTARGHSHLSRADTRGIVKSCNEHCCAKIKRMQSLKAVSEHLTCKQIRAKKPCDRHATDNYHTLETWMCKCIIQCEFAKVDLPTPVPTSSAPTTTPTSLPTTSPTSYPTGAPLDFDKGLDALLAKDGLPTRKRRS